MKIIRELVNIPNDLIRDRHTIIDLSKSDFRNRYLGSYLGSVWALINPIVTICVFIFVFEVGFKAAPVGDVPFIVWLCTGIIPWFYFSEAFSQASASISDYNFLVKKIPFRVSYLPLIRILSAISIHLVFSLLLAVILTIFKIYPSLYWIQYIYYLFAAVILLAGLSFISSSLLVFTKDVGNVITICLQFGFWMTPIFWNIDKIPEKYQLILRLNPVYYIIQGYRDTFIFKVWFWERINYGIYFWLLTLFIFFTGLLIFKKTRPHFADVL